MSKFFIDRPIFAWVIALVIMLAGGLSILSLPVNQYPAIAPPAIAVQVSYPGASAETVQDTVVQVIEQQMNGIDNLRYISSESNSDGSMTITVTFEQGTDPDIAQVQVQNKLQLATPLLPQEVQRQGIRVTKAVKNFLMVVGVVSTDGSMTKEDLSNYIVSNIQDPLSRTKGVGDFQVFGSQYSMRIWLDPAKLNSYQLTPGDVSSAIQAQNVQISSGQLGGLPAVKGQQLNATIIGKTRLQTAEQFENILLKVNPDGSQVRLKDVADVGLGGQDYSINAQFNGSPASGIAIKLATGFDLFLQDQAGVGHEVLLQARNKFLMLAAQNPALQRVRPNGMSDEPQYKLEIDDEKASALGVSLADINSTVSIAWGSSYVNDFIDRGRVKRVYLQGRPDARMNPDDLSKWYVRNDKGEMVPFNAFATGKWEYGSPKLERYNGVPAMEILGEPAPGLSSGDAMAAVEEIVKQLPKGVGYSWTGLSYEERLSGSQAPALYALSLLVVFLCLAALYESWSIPFSVMLVVPLGVIGALLATSMRGLSNDVFFQVGLLTTIGLSAKNAILIVEFAKELHEQGKGIVEAAIEACRMRLRPIVMTSLAFILGVVPLAISTGAGSGSQHAIGTGVIGGMVTATVLAIFWVPLFYVAVSTLFKDEASKQQASVEKGQ